MSAKALLIIDLKPNSGYCVNCFLEILLKSGFTKVTTLNFAWWVNIDFTSSKPKLINELERSIKQAAFASRLSTIKYAIQIGTELPYTSTLTIRRRNRLETLRIVSKLAFRNLGLTNKNAILSIQQAIF